MVHVVLTLCACMTVLSLKNITLISQSQIKIISHNVPCNVSSNERALGPWVTVYEGHGKASALPKLSHIL